MSGRTRGATALAITCAMSNSKRMNSSNRGFWTIPINGAWGWNKNCCASGSMSPGGSMRVGWLSTPSNLRQFITGKSDRLFLVRYIHNFCIEAINWIRPEVKWLVFYDEGNWFEPLCIPLLLRVKLAKLVWIKKKEKRPYPSTEFSSIFK